MICKVIATSFTPRQVRLHENYPGHQQDIKSAEEALEMLKKVVKFETENTPGQDIDIIIVNSDVGFKEGNEYIEQINGTKFKFGKIIAYTKENVGWSFGSYSHAFKKYREDYQYFIFTEDDILIGGNDYAKRLINRWKELENAKVNVGFLSLIGVIKHHYGIHCGGGVGMSSRQVLDKLIERYGMLPHHNKPSQNKNDIIIDGEVAFTNKIDDMGFYLFNFGENNSWNLQENLCIPYFMERKYI